MRALLALLAAATLALPVRARAQEGTPPATISLRVSGTSHNSPIVLVDRGARDGLLVGQRVRFVTKEGRALHGTVVRVQEKGGLVELDDRSHIPAPGTPGEVRLKSDREPDEDEPVVEDPKPKPEPKPKPVPRQEPPPPPKAEPEAALELEAPQADAQGSTGPVPDHPPWQEDVGPFEPDMPLLSEVKAVRPEDRPVSVTGRVYVLGDGTATLDEDRSSSFLRTGTSVLVENPFGLGDGIHFDAELNYRNTELPDAGDESDVKFRLDRLSYYRGGTRFAPERWEAGRFLQYGMPEFGVLDGYEYAVRSIGGDGYGFSAGFMPEPNPDFESGKDFQFAGWYHWEPGDIASLEVDGGYQKTLHNGDADRDLFVLRVQNLPSEGWDFHGTAWVDLYTGGDDKDAGLELTQLYAVTSKRLEGGHGVDVTFTVLRFPDIERFEFLAPDPAQVTGDEALRLAVGGWRQLANDLRLTSHVGIWDDEDDSGGDVELGFERDDLWLEESRAHVTVFDTHGRFTDVLGARVGYAFETDLGRWDLLAEAARQRQLAFNDDIEDVPRYRARVGWGVFTDSGWDVSLYAEGNSWQEDHALSLGFYGQKGF